MNTRQALKANMALTNQVVNAFLGDMSDEDLLVRPIPEANHIAWQLGHIITAEHTFMEAVSPGSMPPLPPGFAEKHSKEASKSNDPKSFCPKAEYLRLMKEQRQGTLALLEKTSDAELDKPAPKSLPFLRTVGDVYVLVAGHPMMHSGQWVVVRRKLGKPVLM